MFGFVDTLPILAQYNTDMYICDKYVHSIIPPLLIVACRFGTPSVAWFTSIKRKLEIFLG